MKPDKITKYGLLEVCELISGTRTKTTDGPYFIWSWHEIKRYDR